MSPLSSTGHTLIDEEKKETLKKQPGMGWNHRKIRLIEVNPQMSSSKKVTQKATLSV